MKFFHRIALISLTLGAGQCIAAAEPAEPPTVTYDIGGSSGSSNGSTTYTEVQLGVNYFILPWLKWRNAPFYRIRSTLPAAYGLDSSLIGTTSLPLTEGASANFGLGGGYRLINTGKSAPFAEGSAGISVGGVRIQGSVKRVFNSVARKGAREDTIYSITFGGGGVLF